MSYFTDLFQSKSNPPRTLINPAHRPPIRADFPCVIYVGGNSGGNFHANWFCEVMEEELAKLNQTPDTITIAYPHKGQSLWRDKPHEMVAHAKRFQEALQKARPNLNWITADGICETRHLDRSGLRGQDMVNTLRKKHRFDFIADEQKTDLPFMRADHSGPSYFILLDDVYAQGTTAASMINFIQHNGGSVLAAASMHKPRQQEHFHLRQYGQNLKSTFNNAAYNKGAIPQIAEELATYIWVSTLLDKDHIQHHLEDYVQELDRALNNVGLSLSALTMGECGRLMDFFRAKPIRHDKFIKTLMR